ncbi:MAG: phosphoadenosine phosphosulfate reductase family protein [Nitrososphaerota archaeon]|nr:phosphoadenosine phosphosulfate reductase family protein [Nitrososphaerota archaeon]
MKTFQSLFKVSKLNYKRWVLTYSGGKDSTLTAILTLIFLENNRKINPNLKIVYSDTLLEIAPLRKAAADFLRKAEERINTLQLKGSVHIVRPQVADTFWVRMLGRGYPPPGPHFRWCTKKLKVLPVQRLLEQDPAEKTLILTGVRYSESQKRKERLVASCANGGECGQDFWFMNGPKGRNQDYHAPIVEWRTCKVWDFLAFTAPQLGWPTENLFKLYGFQDLRFGCWTCTLMKEDRTMQELAGRAGMEHLGELHNFRKRLIELGWDKKRRVSRPDGKMGPMDMETRKTLLSELKSLQKNLRISLISSEELAAIGKEWSKDSWRNR